MEQPAEYHFRLGQELRKLRDENILIVGSGNIVHNLRVMNWETHAPPFDWAMEYDSWIKEKLLAREFQALVHNFRDTEAGRKSVPTMEHYYPLLYTLGATDESDKLEFHFEEIHNSSISMRTMSFG
jgi:4,5-DOPA dioxygenase extradiol